MKNNEKNDSSFLMAGIIRIPLTVFPVMLYYIGIITRYSPDHILSHFEQKQIKNIFSAGGIFMFREMRRKRQALTLQECTAVLQKGTSGVLALSGDNDYPYAVPISYLYEDGRLYFHCARSGHKLDAIRRNPKASFCVIDQDQVVPREYTTYFRSVIAFGTIRILEKDEEKRAALCSIFRHRTAFYGTSAFILLPEFPTIHIFPSSSAISCSLNRCPSSSR